MNDAKPAKPPSPIDVACLKLKKAGLRITRPRLGLLAALIGKDEPATVEELHAVVGSGRCDLVTIYRCLAAFEEIGLARRSFSPDGNARHAIALGEAPDYRVLCRKTGRTEKIDPEAAEELTRALRNAEEKLRARGYTNVSHQVEFFGTASVPDKPEKNF